ncbi:unnamed protein product [Nesidiocoris tenuis]|uniref:Myosin motor domain-containing protein n=1 Tax=Nesidiocoris tenuis TaxID=355587 RepID=A0A6H5G302_9HEMI|nr:unnamed protein product [Nesidiocoris tenuis]
MIRDSLAKALYCRTVATIVRRANSLKRLGSTLGTLSSDSNESVHNQAEPSQLEHLCINLCAETMQHFYNTHIFKSSIESCRDEGIQSDVEVDYVDNVPCIDLISSLVTVYKCLSELLLRTNIVINFACAAF